ncbi:MAG: hypothetical protein CMH62_02505 [Nanoarchaeota archaeon]|nr:hypothetical protein [Nanoarchaeota archaeon]|tara:strand:+ start:190 stop:717 length:528 start_codon:yes stop_codon:yes gene_type:complete
MNNEVGRIYESKNWFIRHYSNKYLKKSVELLDAKEGDVILDFGCGEQHLKNVIRKGKIIGYDIDPNLSDVDDYKKVKANKIFACQSLEHLKHDELIEAIEHFKSMNPEKVIIATSTDNIISEIGIKLIRSVSDSHDTHYSDYKTIHKLMGRYFNLIRKRNIYTLNIVSEWHLKTT